MGRLVAVAGAVTAELTASFVGAVGLARGAVTGTTTHGRAAGHRLRILGLAQLGVAPPLGLGDAR